MKLKFKSIFLCIAILTLANVHAQTQKAFYNIKDFGAKGDGSSN